MENETKQCRDCRHFSLYYTKGVTKMKETKLGKCTRKRNVVGIADRCEEFALKPYNRKGRYSLKIAINGLLTEISQIRKILEIDNGNE